ncbi:MAG: Wzz/FepE/Etk N-terminal domain-containing protein [Longimonas sp.]|uniref:Wzz/FepE/Etk N-terminal domain-containing protein n=1 Tax=Longimonas sp. TaxID=2039626 RepID=UPI003975FD7E
MPESSLPTSESSEQRYVGEQRYAEEEISLLDILVVLARNRRFVIGCVVGLTMVGLIYAITAPEEFTADAQVVREVEGGAGAAPGGLSALRGLGVNLGGTSTGLTSEAYPRILTSREVRLLVARDTFYFADVEQEMTLVDYHARDDFSIGSFLKKYTIGLPGQILQALQSDPPERPVELGAGDEPVYPTEDEEAAMKAVDNMVSSSVDVESGVMSISVTDSDPVRAAEITDSFLTHLIDRVRTIRTEKARQTLTFVDERFDQAREELEAAEQRLAEFNDRNREIRNARLRTERDQLQRQVRFASDLYSEFQAQRTQAQIELQRSEPVITTLEAPTPPMERSAPQRSLIVVLSFVLGGMLGIGGAFVRTFLASAEEDEERQKLEEIKNAFRHPWGRDEVSASEET